MNAWRKYWLTPASPRPLAALRLGLAALLLCQALCVAPSFFAIYASDGLLSSSVSARLGTAQLPTVHELMPLANERLVLTVLGIAYLAALCALLLGYRTRLAAIATWLLHYAFAGGDITSYGVDVFVNIILFYFVFMPIGEAWSMDLLAGRVSGAPSPEARISLRALQLHLSLAYFFCGLHKAFGADWWNGEAIWQSVMLPLYAQADMRLLARAPWLAKIFGWGTLLVETGYPLGMAFRRTRPYWLLAIIGLHLGIFLLMGLHFFALTMILLSTCAFGSAQMLSFSGARQPRPCFSF